MYNGHVDSTFEGMIMAMITRVGKTLHNSTVVTAKWPLQHMTLIIIVSKDLKVI